MNIKENLKGGDGQNTLSALIDLILNLLAKTQTKRIQVLGVKNLRLYLRFTPFNRNIFKKILIFTISLLEFYNFFEYFFLSKPF